MTSESKILTVSYGTFSCTLEGFENPFDTMKAIAEYFRDLAAQDRHFGAEPPPPDAAMLHRLAEREISRLAAAKTDAAPRAEAAGPGEAAEAVAPRILFNPVARRPSHGPVESEAPVGEDQTAAEPALQDAIPDGVAAKLARIRRAVHPAAADLSAPASALLAETAAEETDHAAAKADGETGADPVLDGMLADDEVAVAVPAETPAEVPETAWAWDDSLDADADAGAIATAAAGEDDLRPVAEAEADTRVDSEAVGEDLSDLAALEGALSRDGVLAAPLDETLPEDTAPDLTLAEAEAVDPLPEAAADIDPDTGFDAADAAAARTEASLPVARPVARPGRSRQLNPRVVRLHPDEKPAARDPAATRVLSTQQDSDEVARLMQQAEEVMAEDANRRRQEALSHLKAAVVSTEADRADLDYEAPRADVNLDPYRDDLAEAIQPDAAEAPPAPPAPPEVKPRRKSVNIRPQEPRPGTIRPGMISPPPLVLVSAQRIDRVAPAAAPTLAPAAAPSMAPATPGIAPANPDAQPMVALRTGRLSGAIGAGAAATVTATARSIVLEKPSYGPATEAEDDEDLAEDAREIDESGLAAFAETVGARSMAEMLEAAAAFATCVEKRAQFTRPQLMRRMMASAGGKPVSREDGLRSFGTLLRTGRIEKVARGHYALAETSPYLAEARRLS
jgi:hypothetical protein